MCFLRRSASRRLSKLGSGLERVNEVIARSHVRLDGSKHHQSLVLCELTPLNWLRLAARSTHESWKLLLTHVSRSLARRPFTRAWEHPRCNVHQCVAGHTSSALACETLRVTVARQTGSSLADELAKAAMWSATQRHLCVPVLGPPASVAEGSSKTRLLPQRGAGAPRGANPQPAYIKLSGFAPTRSWRLLACASAVARAGKGGESGGAAFESRMGLEAIHAGRSANPVTMRGLRLYAGIYQHWSPCTGVTGRPRAITDDAHPGAHPGQRRITPN